jgi:hypothetical protein
MDNLKAVEILSYLSKEILWCNNVFLVRLFMRCTPRTPEDLTVTIYTVRN